jgi:hypothetical protein
LSTTVPSQRLAAGRSLRLAAVPETEEHEMSYDLYFEPGKGRTLDKKSFAAYFRGRLNYQVGKGQALYQNEDTGVYFIFDEPDDGIVAMNLNLFRPHTFALEAAREIEAFAKAFAAGVIDPQSEADGAQPFDRAAFLRSYDQANEFAYRSVLPEMEPVHTWPTRRIRDVWRWNDTRPGDEEQEKAGFFVPGIFAAEESGRLISIAIWPPRCAIELPEVDAVMVPLSQEGKASEQMALVPWAEVLPIAKAYREKSADGLPRYRLDNEPAFPPKVAAFLKAKRKPVGKLNGVGLDEILDREVVEAVRKG